MAQGQANGSGAGLQQVHERLHATHAPNPEAEAAPGGDQSLPLGAIRVEEGRYRNPDGSAHADRRSWKLYQFRDVTDQEREAYRAQVEAAGWKVGEQIVQRKWYLVSQHDSEAEALAAAEKL